jgi:hypothetical protein
LGGTETKIINLTFVVCAVGINENGISEAEYRYFDLNGKPSEPIKNTLLIRVLNNKRKLVFIQD